jgi:hypothetical protein
LTNENKEPVKKEEKPNTYLTHVKISKEITEKPILSANEITKHNHAKESKGKCIYKLQYIYIVLRKEY